MTFRVTGVETYPRRFPAELVYGTHGGSALQLVTGDGAFDTATGHCLYNIVVTRRSSRRLRRAPDDQRKRSEET